MTSRKALRNLADIRALDLRENNTLAVALNELSWQIKFRQPGEVSAGIGPGNTSPPITRRSTSASRISSRTASNAGRFAWMSYKAATRMAI
jgi:hypothetical protein